MDESRILLEWATDNRAQLFLLPTLLFGFHSGALADGGNYYSDTKTGVKPYCSWSGWFGQVGDVKMRAFRERSEFSAPREHTTASHLPGSGWLGRRTDTLSQSSRQKSSILLR